MIYHIKKYIRHPKLLALSLLNKVSPLIKDDATFIRLKWKLRMDYPLNLEAPKSFNEKLQWLKLYDRQPIYTTMVDKYEVKEYVSKIIGAEHVIPTIALYERVDDIDFEALPNQFVLKCTHDSGGLVICKDKGKLDIQGAKAKLKKFLHRRYYWQSREWPYKDVKPRIIAEKYLSGDDNEAELIDYKWFCFNGQPKYLFIATDRFNKGEETKFDFYDTNFNHLPFTNGHPNATKRIIKPRGFEQMKALAEKLSSGIPQVRVDFYDVNGMVFFGEMTFSHWSGMVPFKPREWDYIFGDLIKLPEKR